MHKPRMLLAIGTLTALIVGTTAAPVAAASTKLTIVNGIPGVAVDVCVNGREVKSRLPYAKVVHRKTNTAKAVVKFYKRDARRCGGKLLGKSVTWLDDATMVVTKRIPQKVVKFDNQHLAQPIDEGTIVAAFRHAADVGAVEFSYDFDSIDPKPVTPNAMPSADVMTKGTKWDFYLAALDQVWTTMVKQGGFHMVPPDFRWLIDGGRRYEWILVGASAFNARLVFINRPATPA